MSNYKTVVVMGNQRFGKGDSLGEAFENWLIESSWQPRSDRGVIAYFIDAAREEVEIDGMGVISFTKGAAIKQVKLSLEKYRRHIEKINEMISELDIAKDDLSAAVEK